MKQTLLTIGSIILVLVSLSCEIKNSGGTTDTGPIKVGVYMDLSGNTAGFGQSSRDGIKMAADEINQAGGINNRKIELVIEDDQGLPSQAATVAQKLINQDKVHAIVGEVASGNSIAAAKIIQPASIPMITPASTNPEVTQIGDYIFRVCFIDPFQGEVMAKFAYNTLGKRKAAILLDTNSPYSRGLTQFFEESFTKLGGQVVVKQSYSNTDRDFNPMLTAIRTSEPDVIYIPGYYNQVGVIAKQARQQGIKTVLAGGDGWDAPQLWDLGGDALNGAFISNHYSVDDPSPAIQKFVSDYKARYGGTVPDAMAALGYDAIKVLGDAIKRAGTTDRAKLRDAIAQTKDYVGVTGSITINNERNAVKPAVILELQNRKYVYKETIQP
jgi:branched-chain amino acid transport system substrate-binding protein